jgi:hypothetical protein
MDTILSSADKPCFMHLSTLDAFIPFLSYHLGYIHHKYAEVDKSELGLFPVSYGKCVVCHVTDQLHQEYP